MLKEVLVSADDPRMIFKSEEGVLSLIVLAAVTLLLVLGIVNGTDWARVCAAAAAGFSIGRGVRKHGRE
jgi:hypothetical protein